jgi:hypothetical protein
MSSNQRDILFEKTEDFFLSFAFRLATRSEAATITSGGEEMRLKLLP